MSDTFDPRRIPIIGDDIHQVGQAWRIMSQPCGPDPWIAIQAFWAYAPTLIWSLFAPEPLDMVFDRAGRPHHRKRRGKMRVSGVMQLPQPTKPGAGLALFRLAQLGQRVGWYFLIADATTDFLINWTTMTYAWSGCHVSGTKWARFSGGIGMKTQTPEPGTTFVEGAEADFSLGANASVFAVYIGGYGPKTFSGSCTAHVERAFGVQGQVTGVHWIREQQGRQPQLIGASSADPSDPTQPWDASDSILDSTAGPTTWTGRIEHTGGAIYIDDCLASATGAPEGEAWGAAPGIILPDYKANGWGS